LLIAVASVLAQTYRPIEIIIVDDGSTDETAQVADSIALANDGVVRVVHKPNGGVGSAREAGRCAAGGEFIQYLDSDDLLLPLSKSSSRIRSILGCTHTRSTNCPHFTVRQSML